MEKLETMPLVVTSSQRDLASPTYRSRSPNMFPIIFLYTKCYLAEFSRNFSSEFLKLITRILVIYNVFSRKLCWKYYYMRNL